VQFCTATTTCSYQLPLQPLIPLIVKYYNCYIYLISLCCLNVSHRSARCLIKLLYYLFVVCCVHSAANELIIIIIFFSISYLVFPRIFCLSAIEAYIFIKSQCAPSVYGVHYHYYIYQVALCDQSKINLPANNS